VLGYTELAVNPKAYGAAISFDEGLGLCERLRAFAAKRGRRVGFKFSNTLEVVNHRDFFPRDNEIMYLSGQPLHVITMALTARFREAVGPDVPISFSAGIDKQNFPAGVACGFVPVTVSTDLLRPGGYGRMGGYLEKLAEEMQRVGAVSVDEFILKRYGQETEARRRGNDDASAVRWAAVLNTRIAAEEAKADPRYQATKNRKPPTRIDSHLVTFDCITCDKCLPVCPNAANFTYPTPIVAFDYTDWIIDPAGNVHPGECKQFAIAKPMQIACFADFCNECGNCDTFCPEYGGPYIEKPSFFGSVESWERAAPHDGFVIGHSDSERWIRGRIKGIVYELRQAADGEVYFADAFAAATFHDVHRPPTRVELLQPIQQDHVLNAWVFHAMRHLLGGVADLGRMNQVNAVLSTK
jgi:putative selenate reductase